MCVSAVSYLSLLAPGSSSSEDFTPVLECALTHGIVVHGQGPTGPQNLGGRL